MNPNERLLTADNVGEYFTYSRKKGVLRWRYRAGQRRSWNTRFAEKPAGHRRKDGYSIVTVRIDGERRRFLVHRVIWLIVTGGWPKEQIDHINGRRSDNRFCNLREATDAENKRNRTQLRTDNSAGVTGVHWHKNRLKWQAVIKHDRVTYHLGSYKSKAAAIRARRRGERKYFGEFAPKKHPVGVESVGEVATNC